MDGWIDRQTDRQTKKQTRGEINKQTDRQTDGSTNLEKSFSEYVYYLFYDPPSEIHRAPKGVFPSLKITKERKLDNYGEILQ